MLQFVDLIAVVESGGWLTSSTPPWLVFTGAYLGASVIAGLVIGRFIRKGLHSREKEEELSPVTGKRIFLERANGPESTLRTFSRR